MSDKKELKAGLGYTIGNILIKGISFLTLSVFSRLLNTADFGIYNTYVAYEAIISIIVGLGIYSSIKNAKKDYKEVECYVSTQNWICLFTAICILLLCFIFRNQISSFTGFSFYIIVILVFHSFGSAMLNVINARLALEYDYKKYLIFAVFNTILSVGLSIILILTILSNYRADARIIGAAIPMIIIGIYVFYSEGRKSKFAYNKDMAKYAVLFGIPLIWHYLSQQIASQFDRIMISSMVGTAFTGIYSFTYTIANILQIIFYSTDNVWGVWFFGRMETKDYVTIRDKSKKYMTLILFIACSMMFFSKEIIIIMGSKEYWSGTSLFISIIIGIYFLFLYTLPVGIEYFYKETKYIAITTFVSALVNIVLNYLFIPILGYQAAAYTTAISYLVMFFMHWIISNKILKKHNIDSIFKIRDFLETGLAACLIGIIVIILNPYPAVKYVIYVIFILIVCLKNKEDVNILCVFIKRRIKR